MQCISCYLFTNDYTVYWYVLSYSVILRMANCASACPNQAVAFVQNVDSFTTPASAMMIYNVDVSVGVDNEDKMKFV